MAGFTVSGPVGVDIGALNLINYWDGDVRDSTAFEMANGLETLNLYGSGFTRAERGWFPASGTVERMVYANGGERWEATGLSLPVAQFLPASWDEAGLAGVRKAFTAALAGRDAITGGAGADSLSGDGGDDTIEGGAGSDYLRGNAGADLVLGGAHFDDINGNEGNDTARGGDGDDWVVGGKDDDLLYGDAGGDLVYGNLGNDTCEGGEGADTLRGGQREDVVNGGAGDDWIAGDRGDDILSGGAGADVFHSFGEAGLDRVTDFSAAEGDRVRLDPGTVYTVAQVGADTVISMAGGGRMVLVGVESSRLTPGWIDSGLGGRVLTAAGPGSVLAGGEGADTIVASEGADTLSGGAGPDVFVIPRFPMRGAHHITDFTPGEDRLDLRGLAHDQGYPGSGSSFNVYIYVDDDGRGGAVVATGVNVGADLIHLDAADSAGLSMSNWIIS
ncbi:MAG: calcium-binding protein [Phenylobacterium sp.]|uniref:calcium-binding protein n=1 Tax=Phenylobacterium sp. TaxID=1871053 RepID=UPI001218D003|nr:calcium-binding protein [Phenylobacterium sp.]TAJ69482.1 MAG: calcium-binding protein [Phenylobacterium sp.]